MLFKNAISWFEIPAIDMDRAQAFYETIFQISMIPMAKGDVGHVGDVMLLYGLSKITWQFFHQQ